MASSFAVEIVRFYDVRRRKFEGLESRQIMVEHGKVAVFRFHGELNDFLDPARRHRRVRYAFSGTPGIKDAIEAVGVPHAEVGRIVVGDQPVGFDFRIEGGEAIDVYAGSGSGELTATLRDPLEGRPRFVLDTHLGKLARLLRLLGFDTLYRNDFEDAEIVRISVEERRIALTRDRGILKHGDLIHGYCVRSDAPMDQISEIVARFDLARRVETFSRCTICNGPVRTVPKEAVEPRLLPRTRRDHAEFRFCDGCDRIYWKGSHYTRLRRLADRICDRASRRLPDGA